MRKTQEGTFASLKWMGSPSIFLKNVPWDIFLITQLNKNYNINTFPFIFIKFLETFKNH